MNNIDTSTTSTTGSTSYNAGKGFLPISSDTIIPFLGYLHELYSLRKNTDLKNKSSHIGFRYVGRII